MLTLRQRIFLIVGAVLATLAIILAAGYYLNERPPVVVPPAPDQTEPVSPPTNNPPPSSANNNGGVPVAKPISPTNGNDVYMRQLAGIFVERFASYSNQNDNKHIEDSLVLATPSMQSWMVKQALEQSAEYQGVTTKVVSAFLQNKEKDKAVVSFTAQQVLEKKDTTSNSTQKEIIQRKGRVELVNTAGGWKVNGMWWE